MRSFIVATLFCLILGNAVAAPFTELVRLDCSGELVLLPEVLNLRVAVPNTFVTDIINEIFDRFNCSCGGTFEKNEFLFRYVPSLGPILSALESGNAYPDSMMTTCPEFSGYMNISLPMFTLPETCTFEKWQTNEGCTLKGGVSIFNGEIGIATKQCPNYFPYLSINCVGEDCTKLLYPCETDADCNGNGGTFSCFDPVELPALFDAEVRNWTQYDNYLNILLAKGGFVNMPGYSFCPDATTPPGDVQHNAQYVTTGSAPGFNAGILHLFNYLRVLFGGEAQTKEKLFKVCIPDIGSFSEITGPENITLSAWDGSLSAGVGVFNESFVSPVLPEPSMTANTSADIVPILELACDGNVYVLPSHPMQFAVSVGKIQDHINAIFTAIKTMEEGRATAYGTAFNAGELNYHYIISDPAFFLYYLTTSPAEHTAADAHLDSRLITPYDLLSKLFSNRPGSYKIELPKGCTKSDFLAHKCEFAYIGLKNLTGLSSTLRVKVEQCAAKPQGLPHITIDMQGVLGELVTAPKHCEAAGAVGGMCPAGTKCTDFEPFFYDDLGVPISPFASFVGETCAPFSEWVEFLNTMIRIHFNTELPLTKNDLLYCFMDMTVEPQPFIAGMKDSATHTSKINGLIAYCDETKGTCVMPPDNKDSEGTSGARSLVPSMLVLVLGLFLTGRRSVALALAVMVLAVGAQGYVNNIEVRDYSYYANLTEPTIPLEDALPIYLTFDLDSWIPDGWCNNLEVEATLLDSGDNWCEYCDDTQSFRLTFKPKSDMCTTPYLHYNNTTPFIVYAQFASRAVCMPSYGRLYSLRVKVPCGDYMCEDMRMFSYYNHPEFHFITEEDVTAPVLVGQLQLNATTVDVTTIGKGIRIQVAASDVQNVVSQLSLSFSSCKYLEGDDAYDGDTCKHFWPQQHSYERTVSGTTTTFVIDYFIPRGFPATTMYISAEISDGCNMIRLRPCELKTGDAKIVVVNAVADTNPPRVYAMSLTPDYIGNYDYSQHNYTIAFDIKDDHEMSWVRMEFCKVGSDGNCRGFEIYPWSDNVRMASGWDETHWIGEIDISLDDYSCGQWYSSRLEMGDSAQNYVRLNLCSKYQSRDNLPATGLSFIYDTQYCYYEESDDYCSGGSGPLDFFAMLMDDRAYDQSLL